MNEATRAFHTAAARLSGESSDWLVMSALALANPFAVADMVAVAESADTALAIPRRFAESVESAEAFALKFIIALASASINDSLTALAVHE